MKRFLFILCVVALIVFSQMSPAFSKDFQRITYAKAISWKDKGIVYGAGEEKAYYPCVLFDENGFDQDADSLYKMWYSDGSGTVSLVTSENGKSWEGPIENTGLSVTLHDADGVDYLSQPHHLQVVYDSNCFGYCTPDSIKYKVWYWDKGADRYSINAIGYAESPDGIQWDHVGSISQNEENPLVTGNKFDDWNTGSYGPVDVFYQPEALDTGDNPWNFMYVMFYNGTNGGNEEVGLAYSIDGLHWVGYAGNPVLRHSPLAGAWDSDDAAFGTVMKTGATYHFWYSGGSDLANEGIGYAFSLDGLTWTKVPDPIFHITDSDADHRSNRTYTPAVLENEKGKLLMFYSAKNIDDDYAIGFAKQKGKSSRFDD